jgi:hypothetical protein
MTKAEREHYAKLSEMGCIACIILGHGYSPAEIHHIRSGAGMAQKNHYSKAVPLCHAHHRTGGYSVAIHSGVKAFEKMIGMSEVDLVKQTKLILEGLT